MSKFIISQYNIGNHQKLSFEKKLGYRKVSPTFIVLLLATPSTQCIFTVGLGIFLILIESGFYWCFLLISKREGLETQILN